MTKMEKIGIIIMVILSIVLAVSIWAESKNKSDISETTDICESLCSEIENDNWVFMGEKFPTQESCIDECEMMLKQ